MTVRRSYLLLALFALALACFISGPAVSGENPWDADGDVGTDDPGIQTDTTDDLGSNFTRTYASSRDTGGNWFDQLYISLTYRVGTLILDLSTTEVRVDRAVSIGGSQAAVSSVAR